MSPTIKRVLLIAALLVISVLIGFALYFAFKKTAEAPTPAEPTPAEPGAEFPAAGERPATPPGEAAAPPGAFPPAGVTVPPAANVGYYRPEPVTRVTTDQTLYPSSAGGALRYHNASDGLFYRVKDGVVTALSDQVFYNVEKVTWAKNNDKAVIEYPDDSKIVYDFSTRRQVTLPKHWEDFSFSNDSTEIVAKSIGIAPENRWLVVTKDDGTGTRLVEPLGNNADKVIIDWSPSRQTVGFAKTGEALGGDRREILLVGLNNENFKSLVVEGLDFVPQWSPSGEQLLYSVDSARTDFKPELWVVNAYGDAIGTNRRSLEINTWADKCAFGDENTLYCAVPQSLPTGAGMSPLIAADIYDDLYKIDLKTGLKTPIALDNDYTVDTISYDAAGNKIFFTDRHQYGAFQVNL